jgi:hypothetical protein
MAARHQSSCHPRGRVNEGHANFLKITDALLPPNAYALFIATSTRVARAVFGT